jgi:hypothetical protein
MKSIQGLATRITDIFVRRREDLPQQPSDSQPQKSHLKKLDSDDAFRNPDRSPDSTPSSNTEYVNKPAIVNKLEDGNMTLKLPSPKE